MTRDNVAFMRSVSSPSTRIAIACGWVFVQFASGLIAGTITGSVTDAQTGNKLPSMVVAAYGTAGLLQATATTDSAGRYSLSLPGGTFRLLAYDNAALYATSFAGDAESFETSPSVSGDQTNYNFALIRGGSAGGIVVGGGRSVAGITVAAYNLSGTRRSFTTTIANGTYSMVLPPGIYKFVAFDGGALYLPLFYSDQATFESAGTVSIQSQRNVGLDFSLHLALRINGTVSDAQTHLPLATFIVSAYTVQGSLVATTVSDGLGRYQLIVPDGTFRLLAADPAHVYATAYFAGANSFAQTQGLTLAPGQSRDGITIEAERGGTVAGHITANGAKVCCTTVSAYNPDGSLREQTLTDGNGSYGLLLPAGDFRIGAYDGTLAYAPQFYTAAKTFHAATPLSVSRSVTTGSVDLSLERAAHVTGRVSDQGTGSPVASVVVGAYDSEGNLAATASTSSLGAYSLGVAPGTYRFVAFDPAIGYASAYPELATTFEDSPAYDLVADTSRSVDFTLVRGTRVSGTAVDQSGTPLSGIEIGALSANRGRAATASTRSGAFDLILAPGIYRLVASDPRGRFLTMYFNGAWVFGNATPVTVSTSGSSSGSVAFILLPRVRRHSAGR